MFANDTIDPKAGYLSILWQIAACIGSAVEKSNIHCDTRNIAESDLKKVARYSFALATSDDAVYLANRLTNFSNLLSCLFADDLKRLGCEGHYVASLEALESRNISITFVGPSELTPFLWVDRILQTAEFFRHKRIPEYEQMQSRKNKVIVGPDENNALALLVLDMYLKIARHHIPQVDKETGSYYILKKTSYDNFFEHEVDDVHKLLGMHLRPRPDHDLVFGLPRHKNPGL